MRREYKTGTKWCVWRWKDMFWNNELYLRRLILFQCPLFSVFLHWFHNPDKQAHLHDHPVNFLSIILRGGYEEVRKINGWRLEQRGYGSIGSRFNFVSAYDAHRVARLHGKPLTLCIAGRRLRQWGFHTQQGWIRWQEYEKIYNGSTT